MNDVKNHIEKIFSLMEKNRKDIPIQNELLEHFYSKATPSEQKIIDTIMMCICGYSLDTIINHPENIKN